MRLAIDGELELGRDCDGLLLADTEVSRRHLRLRPVGDAIEAADLDSTNGTFIGDDRIDHPRLLQPGQKVRLGSTTVEVEGRVGADTVAGTTGRATSIAADLRRTSIDVVADAVAAKERRSADDSGPTTTILFSDIESSTERATSMGDAAWYTLLEAHNSVIREELHGWGGKEIKSVGDGFMCSFSSVRRGIGFAVAVQRRIEDPHGPDLRVRMGLHTGEVITDATGDLFGRHVNLAARVANLAGGGEIMASLVVHEISAGRDDLVWDAPLVADLKGFAEPETVFRLMWESAA